MATAGPAATGRLLGVAGGAGLALSAIALAAAPAVLPPSYRWVAHTTSEAAGQGVPGAWLARSGFVLFALAVALITVRCRRRWSRWGVALHGTFALGMAATAAFPARSWEAAAAYDPTVDMLHSVAATALGFAFAFGVAVVGWRVWASQRRWRWLDVTAVTASIVLPLGMVAAPAMAGVLQRTMFLVAYVWYARESLGDPSLPAAAGPSSDAPTVWG